VGWYSSSTGPDVGLVGEYEENPPRVAHIMTPEEVKAVLKKRCHRGQIGWKVLQQWKRGMSALEALASPKHRGDDSAGCS
jgi:hypothetical protein